MDFISYTRVLPHPQIKLPSLASLAMADGLCYHSTNWKAPQVIIKALHLYLQKSSSPKINVLAIEGN